MEWRSQDCVLRGQFHQREFAPIQQPILTRC